jgi:GTP:adenosylcobinamide-phosphate guanylyltransferase
MGNLDKRIPSMLFMAGGKGTRIGNPEKYLLKFGRKTIIEALLEATMQMADAVYLSTVPGRKVLMDICARLNIITLMGGGTSYVDDLFLAAGHVGRFPLLVIPGDIVLLDKHFLSQFIEIAKESDKELVNLYANGELSGICIMKRRPADSKELPYENINFQGNLLVNVNTWEDYERALISLNSEV